VATVKLLCFAISSPRSHVNERRSDAGSLRTWRFSAATTTAVSLLGTFTSAVKRGASCSGQLTSHSVGYDARTSSHVAASTAKLKADAQCAQPLSSACCSRYEQKMVDASQTFRMHAPVSSAPNNWICILLSEVEQEMIKPKFN